MILSNVGEPEETRLTVQGDFVYFKPPCWSDWFYETVGAIPASDRRWYPVKRVWAFRAQHLDAVAKLVREAFFSEPAIVQEAR